MNEFLHLLTYIKVIFNGILPITDKKVQPKDENTALGAMLLAERVRDWLKEKHLLFALLHRALRVLVLGRHDSVVEH